MRRFNPDGNERLTATNGLVLIILSAAEILTLLLGLGATLSWHVAIGLALLPPVALKLGSTGWRFVRYYTRNADYRAKGAPQIVMRALAPLFVLCTVVLFGSGVAMGFLHGGALQWARRLHGPSSVGWMILLGLHVLVYIRRALHESRARDVVVRVAVAASLAAGLVVGLVTVPDQHPWLHAHHHHERDGRDR